jgi:hypothetical protein
MAGETFRIPALLDNLSTELKDRLAVGADA